MKKSSLAKAVAWPTALVLGLAGSALVAAPTSAAAPVGASSAVATSSSAPAATPAPTASAVPSAAPSAAPSPVPTSVPTPAPTSAPTPPARVASPATPALAPAPTDLTVTSPVSKFPGVPIVVASRTVDFTGTAPVGSEIFVEDWSGTDLAHIRKTTTTSFTATVVFPADVPYQQFVDVYGVHGKDDLTDVPLALELPAPDSVVPVVSTPAAGASFAALALPFTTRSDTGTEFGAVDVSGTGTAGENIVFFFTAPGAAPDTNEFDEFGSYTDDGAFGSMTQPILVGPDGTWSSQVFIPVGSTSLQAVQQKYDQTDEYFDEALSHASDLTAPVVITVTKSVVDVEAPRITTPAWDPIAASQAAVAASSLASPLDRARQATKARAAVLEARKAAWASPTRGISVPKDGWNLRTPAAEADFTYDDLISEIGARVTGTASSTRHGFLETTVAGTGTPGDHIALYAEDGNTAIEYLFRLYPNYLRAILGGDLTGISDVDASLLPEDDGSIVVDATGHWSTTLTLKPGNYLYTAFAVDPTSAEYSLAGNVVLVHLSGTPIVDPAAVSTPVELAFTGSRTPWAALVGAVGALVAGASLLVVAARRRRTE